ncbi:MAG: hypothetical protein K2G58_02970 [Alistipes sp.]|nr:hypothetical protein [Alistipes sp.]
MKLGLLVFLCAIAAMACFALRAVLRGRDKRSLLRNAHGIGSSLSEDFGISVLCSGIDVPERIESLLASEYTRFEVIAVLDAAGFPEEFAALTARYRMMRVEWQGSQEFRAAGVRSLWRSRRRSCRRLVLVDRPQGTVDDEVVADWNAAAAVSSYDWLLPLSGRVSLLPDAVTRLVAELGEYPVGTLTVVRSHIGVPVLLVARDVVMDAGGFGARWMRGIPRRSRSDLWEPLAYRADRTDSVHSCRKTTRLFRWFMVAALALTGWTIVAGYWMWAAVAATAAVVLGAVSCARQAMMRIAGGRCVGLRERP